MNNQYDLKYFVKRQASDTWHLNDTVLNYYDLTFILEGEAVYTSDGQNYRVSAGEAVFLQKGSSRQAKTKGMQCVAFNFDASMSPFPTSARITWNNDSVLKAYFEDSEQAWKVKSDIGIMRCQGLFLLVLSRLLELQQLKQYNPYVLQMKKYLHQHYTERVTVQMVGDHVKLSPIYCGALFSKETGSTILAYVNHLRVTKAKELLNYTNASISEIASEVGMDDLYYFSRIFKKMTGFSPRQYRMRQKKDLAL